MYSFYIFLLELKQNLIDLMAEKQPMKQRPLVGVIIVGNSGAGKSFLCNLLIGEDIFESKCTPEGVTKVTETYKISCGGMFDFLIYDIPGMIDADQDDIENNKKEIEKAFNNCPESIVIFAFRETGGRAQLDDIIAFKALQASYRFPPNCLMFVLNNIPADRPTEFDGKFMVTVSKLLPLAGISNETMFFLQTLNRNNSEEREDQRLKLFTFLSKRKPELQQKYQEIILRIDEINKHKAALRKQQVESEALNAALRREIEQKTKEQEAMRKQADIDLQKLKAEIKRLEAVADKNTNSSGVLMLALGGAAGGSAIGLFAGPIGVAVFGTMGALVGAGVGIVKGLISYVAGR